LPRSKSVRLQYPLNRRNEEQDLLSAFVFSVARYHVSKVFVFSEHASQLKNGCRVPRGAWACSLCLRLFHFHPILRSVILPYLDMSVPHTYHASSLLFQKADQASGRKFNRTTTHHETHDGSTTTNCSFDTIGNINNTLTTISFSKNPSNPSSKVQARLLVVD
jgi:hypothetical protein